MAWQGSLPVPEFARTRGHPPKKAALAADLLEIWNSSFFVPRGVELVLYKGRERRSGPFAGRVDIEIPAYGDVDDVSDSSDSSSDSSGLSDDGYGANIYGVYGRQPPAQMSEAAEARRRRHEKKAEKKRRKREKKIRRKAREREKKYALYLTCVRQGGAVGNGAIGGISGGLSGTAGSMGGGYNGTGGMPGGLNAGQGGTYGAPDWATGGGGGALGGEGGAYGMGGMLGGPVRPPGGYGEMPSNMPGGMGMGGGFGTARSASGSVSYSGGY